MVKRTETVSIGRVVVINYGPLSGKIATILDIVDGARALVDGPEAITGVKRQTIPLRNLSLTSIHIPIGRACRPSILTKHLKDEKVLEQWNNSNWARKAARHHKRTQLTDFERFKLMVLKKKRSRIIGKEFAKLRKAHHASSK